MNGIPLELPAWVPALDALAPLVEAAATEFGVEPAYTGRLRARGADFEKRDDAAAYLIEHGHVLGEGRDGALYVECPWKEGHSGDSGITEAAWLPAGTGGYERGHFHCLHASCAARTDDEFLEKIGCGASADFDELPAAAATRSAKPGALAYQWFGDIGPQLSGLWLIKRLLPASGLALIYGHPGSGKSFLALDLAFQVALEWERRGRRVRRGLVVYVGAEGLAGLKNRMVAFRHHHRIAADTPVPLALVPSAIDLQAANSDTPRLIELIRQAADESGYDPALIVVDTLSKTFGAGKENTDDMATYVANCGKVAEAFACCVLPVHHWPKDSDNAEPRGHGSLKGGVDTVILVEAGRVRKATVTKQKDGPEGVTELFGLLPIYLGEDEDGEDVTSCIVQPAVATVDEADPLAQAIAALPDGPKLALRQLDEATVHDGVSPPAEIPDAEIDRVLTPRVVATGTWRERAIQAAGTDRDMDRDTGKKAFNRALKVLQTRGIVGVWGEYAWLEAGAPGQAGT